MNPDPRAFLVRDLAEDIIPGMTINDCQMFLWRAAGSVERAVDEISQLAVDADHIVQQEAESGSDITRDFVVRDLLQGFREEHTPQPKGEQ